MATRSLPLTMVREYPFNGKQNAAGEEAKRVATAHFDIFPNVEINVRTAEPQQVADGSPLDWIITLTANADVDVVTNVPGR